MDKVLVFIITIMFVSISYAQIVGTNGATYSVVEQDAYDELMEKVKKIDWNKVINQYQTSANKTTKVNFNLGKAREDRTFTVDPTYTLQFDIMDETGKIIYPKGFSFNPLDYLNFPYFLVFFNANSVTEIAWIKKQEWFNNWNVIYLTTTGDVLKAEKSLGRTVFAVIPQMIEKFNISKTPSILFIQNRQIVIKEVGVYGKEKK